MSFFLSFIIVIYLITLNRRVRTLEEQLQKKSEQVAQPVASFSPIPVAATTASATFTPASIPESSLSLWLKQDTLMKIGVLLMLIAFGWFVSYAFANNWVGPVGRITLGLLAGLAIMVFGFLRVRTQQHQGAVFAVMGSTLILLTTYAAREMYGFLSPAVALAVMFASVVGIGYLAIRERLQSLAIAGLVLGAIAPLLTNSPEPSAITLFTYLLVLVLGAFFVMVRINATAILPTAFTIVALFSLPFMERAWSDPLSYQALLFGFLFTVLFVGVSAGQVLSHGIEKIKTSLIYVTVGSGLYVAVWIGGAVSDTWQAMMLLAWGGFFLSVAYLLYLRTRVAEAGILFGAVSVGLLAAATAEQFNGPALTIAYTLEVTALIALVSIVTRDTKMVLKTGWLFVGPLLLSLEHIGASSWNTGVLHVDFFALLNLTICLFIAGLLVRETTETETTFGKPVSGTMLVLGALYTYALIWLVTHAVMLEDFATTTSLVVYTISGLVLYVQGMSTANKRMQTLGACVVGAVVLRLLFIDVWQMELAGRIVTFFAIGILLISTAFVKKFQKSV